MDESWQMRMGMHKPISFQKRRSMEEDTSTSIPSADPTRHSMEARLDPEDFSDVFGGPPRSVLSRKFSDEFTRSSSTTSSSFYEEVFRQQDFVSTAKNRGGGRGRSLPAFRIPARGEGFYSDVFGLLSEKGCRRSRERSRPNSKAKSKSNSSSVLSSEELSPLRRLVTGDDGALSSFASKLRPINVPYRWNSSTMGPEGQPSGSQWMPSFLYNQHSPYANTYNYMENEYNDNLRSASYAKHSQQVSSPETISLEPNSYRSVKVSVDDLELNSPASPVSSLCQEPEEAKAGVPYHTMMLGEEMLQQDEDEGEDEVMSSYVIEINSDHKEGASEAVSIDEAIAWAKEKFQSQSFDRVGQHENVSTDHDHLAEMEERPSMHDFIEQQIDGHGSRQSPTDEELQKRKTEEVAQSEKNMEMDLLDEEIRLWSAGKETNIRLLLSTLHHILCPNSGWGAIPLTSLINSSQVKKAYQKGSLCLHPDKLQQRGATLPQKYVAEKAFSILQDAWAAFISQDVLFN